MIQAWGGGRWRVITGNKTEKIWEPEGRTLPSGETKQGVTWRQRVLVPPPSFPSLTWTDVLPAKKCHQWHHQQQTAANGHRPDKATSTLWMERNSGRLWAGGHWLSGHRGLPAGLGT